MKISAPQFSLLLGGMLLVAGCATHATSWEYRTRTSDSPKGKSLLDQYGKSGWELVDYTCRPKDNTGTNFVYQYVFKRPKQ